MFQKLFFILIIGILFSGCTHRVIDFTLISSKNIDLTHSNAFKKHADRVKGEDTVHIIVFIPTKGPISPKEAMDEAIESVPGAVALVDGIVYHYFIMIPMIYAQGAWIVEGTPLIDTTLANIQKSDSNYLISLINPESNKPMKIFTDKNTFENLKEMIVSQDNKGITEILQRLHEA